MLKIANDSGKDEIQIDTREFECIGASPPFDHPHIFLDMGDDDQIVCPYCSTLYRLGSSRSETKTKEPRT
ncbi:MAG: zinc-finger domain-containing protein [Hyphomicrobiales bacterium]|nr:zinc-finger domain-containing protein [Hyphomicrobiales bacterium]